MSDPVNGRDAIHRRDLMRGLGGLALLGAGGIGVASLTTSHAYEPIMRLSDSLGRRLQRSVLGEGTLAPEFARSQLTASHPTNGGFGAAYIEPDSRYDAMLATGFRDWRLSIEGLVARPQNFSLDQLRTMPHRTQITMHCCDMGWSAIGEWTGVPLRWLLEYVGIRDDARYIVFYCMDKFMGGLQLFSSIDRTDAFRPQTILAYGMNGGNLPRQHGAPLRLRSEMQIGYKQSKHIERIAIVSSLDKVGKGYGGLYEDMGYQWYAGM